MKLRRVSIVRNVWAGDLNMKMWSLTQKNDKMLQGRILENKKTKNCKKNCRGKFWKTRNKNCSEGRRSMPQVVGRRGRGGGARTEGFINRRL